MKRIETIYEKESRHPTEKTVIAENLGYTGINGSSSRVIAALLTYGLLENVGEKMRVSDDAFTILIHDRGDPERARVIEEAASKPTLFFKLFNLFGDSLPSNSTLRTHLLKEGFNKNVVDDVVRLFRATIEFVREERATSGGASNNTRTEEPHLEEVHMDVQDVSVRPRQPQPVQGFVDPSKLIHLPAMLAEDNWQSPLEFQISQDCRARVMFKGRVTQRAMNKFIKLLEISVDVFPEDETPGEVLKPSLEPPSEYETDI